MSDNVKDILEKVSDDNDDIFEKVSDNIKDILEKVFDDGDDIQQDYSKHNNLRRANCCLMMNLSSLGK